MYDTPTKTLTQEKSFPAIHKWEEGIFLSPWAKDFFEKILAFHASYKRNEWIVCKDFKIYIRKSKRRHGYMFDIATVEVSNPGKGTFKGLLFIIEPLAIAFGFDGIFVENVMDDRFKAFFVKNGWTREELPGAHPDMPTSFLKMFYSEGE